MELFSPSAWSTTGVDVFVFLVLKGVPLTIALLLARRLLKGAGPATRAGAWAVGITGLALLPFLQLELARRAGWGTGVVTYPETWLKPATGGWPIGTWLLLIWGAGALYFAVRFVGSLAVVALKTRRTRSDVPERIRSRFERALSRSDLDRTVRLRVGDVPAAPLTWGWIRPSIVLPPEAAGWNAEQLDAVLLHELEHVRRHDFLLLVAMEAARAVHWPNPFLWHLLRGARSDQELACDAATLRHGVDRETYARHLLALARSQVPQAPARSRASLSVVSRSGLARRIRFVLDGDSAGARISTGVRVGFAFAGSGLVLALASVNPWLNCL